MSTRITKPGGLQPVAAGDPCSVCWGLNKPFGSGDTPESFEITFENIEKGPDWNPSLGEPIDGTFEVTQDVISPCIFRGDVVGGGGILIVFGESETTVIAFTIPGNSSFVGNTGPCIMVVGNNVISTSFEGGTAVMRFPDIL